MRSFGTSEPPSPGLPVPVAKSSLLRQISGRRPPARAATIIRSTRPHFTFGRRMLTTTSICPALATIGCCVTALKLSARVSTVRRGSAIDHALRLAADDGRLLFRGLDLANFTSSPTTIAVSMSFDSVLRTTQSTVSPACSTSL